MKLENIVHVTASTGQAETLASVTASAIRHEPARRMLAAGMHVVRRPEGRVT